jgi:hypothetical protein
VKLLIDEMYSPIVTRRLCEEHAADAVPVLDRSDLRGRPDDEIFEVAQLESRTIVTENVPDYLRLARNHVAAGGLHHGLVLTTNRGFPRARPSTTARLVEALADVLAHSQDEEPSNREVWL